MRLFVALDPGEAVLARIKMGIDRIRATAKRAKWVRVEGIHVTLVFLGEVPVPDEVLARTRDVASRHGPLTLRFEGAGCFGGKKPRVLWAGVSGDIPALAALQGDLAAALADLGQGPPDTRAYTPHLTLARAADSRGDPALLAAAAALQGETFGETHLREIVVYRSDPSPSGAVYTALARETFRKQEP